MSPALTVAPTAPHVGDRLQVSGKWFAGDCYDTRQPGLPSALTGLELQVQQDGHTWTVAEQIAAAGDHFTFHRSVRVPSGLRPGRADVFVRGYGAPVSIQVLGPA